MLEKRDRWAGLANIAVVDDDASVRQSLFRLLTALGYQATVYSSVTEYLNRLDLTQTSLIILDVQMPVMSGLDLQHVIRDLDTPTPIIFITGYAEDDIRARALELGAVGFLEKPFDDQVLIDLIHKGLNSSKAVHPH